jgi:hypothetical protein
MPFANLSQAIRNIHTVHVSRRKRRGRIQKGLVLLTGAESLSSRSTWLSVTKLAW